MAQPGQRQSELHAKRSYRTLVVTPHTEPDDLGRQQFTVEWDGFNPATGLPMRRGQVFFASIKDFTRREKAQGHNVKVKAVSP